MAAGAGDQYSGDCELVIVVAGDWGDWGGCGDRDSLTVILSPLMFVCYQKDAPFSLNDYVNDTHA